MNRFRSLLLTFLLLISPWSSAAPILSLALDGKFEANYQKVSSALEAHRFFVVFEPNIGQSISRFEKRWGEDYNRNNFTAMRSLVFCNPWYVNQVSNQDPAMLALCPLSVTLTQQGNTTALHMLRPSVVGAQSPARELLEELEADLLKALESTGARKQ